MKKIIIIFLSLLILVGCSNNTSTDQEKKEFIFADTTFNAENGEPDINPYNDYAGWACIRYGVGETLFKYSDSMELEPWLASSYKLIDEYTWAITIKDNIYFSNGKLMDAAAVKSSIEELVKVHNRAKSDLDIASIEIDTQDVIIKTNSPKPALLNYLSDPYGCIIDTENISNNGIVVGTGPYIAKTLVTNQKLELEKNTNYWNGMPQVDNITVLTISDGDTLTMALQSGEVDAAYGLPYASYPLFENNAYTFTSTATSRTFFARMNYDSPITSDVAVRKAIAYGINKVGFVDTLLDGNGYVASGPFPTNYLVGENIEVETYDVEKAKNILEEAGWKDTDNDGIREKNGTKLEIKWLTYPSRQELPLLAESAQATLKEIGISVIINVTADHNSIKKDTSKWDVYTAAMVTAPTGDLEYFFTSCALLNSIANNGNYYNEQLEQLASTLAITFDVQERTNIAKQMQQIILDDNAFIFASHLSMSMVYKSNVKGLVAHPSDYYEITVDLRVE